MKTENKKYVPYGINRQYYVYDNENGQIPLGYGFKYGTKKHIQSICNKLNAEEEKAGTTKKIKAINNL